MSKLTRDGDKLTIQPEQDIAGTKVDELKSEFKQALDEGVSQLVVDMAKIEMMDSMGIGLLIATHNSLSKKNQQLELINVSDDITKLLRLMRLDQHFLMNHN